MLSKKYSLTWFQEKYIDLLEMSPGEDSFQDLIVYPDWIISLSQEGRKIEVICENDRRYIFEV